MRRGAPWLLCLTLTAALAGYVVCAAVAGHGLAPERREREAHPFLGLLPHDLSPDPASVGVVPTRSNAPFWTPEEMISWVREVFPGAEDVKVTSSGDGNGSLIVIAPSSTQRQLRLLVRTLQACWSGANVKRY